MFFQFYTLSFKVTANAQGLAVGRAFIAVSACLPKPGKDILFSA
jgi:hypothetical protein